METQLYTECITCGHSIPLGDTYCGDDECLNRYAEDNELEGHPYADYTAWLAVAPEAHAEVDYHEWAVAHRDLERLESEPVPLPDDAEQIAMLRAALSLTPRAAADASPKPTRYTEASEHPTYSHFDWRQAVAERSTELGYHDWAVGQAEAEWPEKREEPLTPKDAEIEIIGALVYALLKTGFSITIDDTTPEYEVTKSRDWHEVFGALRAAGEDELLLYPPGQDEAVGWIHLVYGNEGYTVIADYSDNEPVRAIIEQVQPVADYCEARCNGAQGAVRPALAEYGPAELKALLAVPA